MVARFSAPCPTSPPERFAPRLLVAKSEDWGIKADVAAQLLPRKKYPQAWRTSKSGGNVTTEVGPLADE